MKIQIILLKSRFRVQSMGIVHLLLAKFRLIPHGFSSWLLLLTLILAIRFQGRMNISLNTNRWNEQAPRSIYFVQHGDIKRFLCNEVNSDGWILINPFWWNVQSIHRHLTNKSNVEIEITTRAGKHINLGPDKDRRNFRNLERARTRAGKIVEIPDQLGSGPIK